jgi:CHASE2 domain-containing sensor protein
VLHYAGLTATGAQLQAAVEAALGRPLERRSLPWGWLRLAAPLAAMPRALLEMRYLWQRPHRLDGSRLAALIGPTAATPLATVVRACLDALPAAAAGPAGAAGRPQAQ